MTSIGKKSKLTRRSFLKSSSFYAFGAPVVLSSYHSRKFDNEQNLTCRDIADHFRATETGKKINWDNTYDTFKAGDPTRKVKKIAVTWKASWNALKEASEKGAEMLISHESICVNAVSRSKDHEVNFALPSEKPKFDWLEKTGLVVYRCHDVWDRFPEIGIRDTWQKKLNIGSKIFRDEYPFYVTEITPIKAGDLARHVLKQIKPLGQNGILISGNSEKIVSRIGTGTGVNAEPVKLKEIGADIGIMTDDYYVHVRMGVHANELDFPTIFVNHGVAEEWGVMNLAQYLQKAFPSLEVFHIPQYCPYKIIVE